MIKHKNKQSIKLKPASAAVEGVYLAPESICHFMVECSPPESSLSIIVNSRGERVLRGMGI